MTNSIRNFENNSHELESQEELLNQSNNRELPYKTMQVEEEKESLRLQLKNMKENLYDIEKQISKKINVKKAILVSYFLKAGIQRLNDELALL